MLSGIAVVLDYAVQIISSDIYDFSFKVSAIFVN